MAITRRGFLGAVAALPFVGKFVSPEPKTFLAFDTNPSSIVSFDDNIWISAGDEVYHFKDDGSFAANRLLRPLDNDATIRRLTDYIHQQQANAFTDAHKKLG